MVAMGVYSTLEMRRKAVRAVEGGMGVADVAAAYQTHRASVYRWCKRYRVEGDKGLTRKDGSGRPRLFEEIDDELLTDLVLSSALDFGYESDLWTCRRLQQTIRRKFGVKLSRWTVWRRLREADITYQKPERKYHGANDEERRRWLRYEIPKIRRAVKKHRAILYFEDESNLSLTALLGKSWAPCGKTPTQRVSGKRGGVAAMSAISGVGRLVFKLHKKRIASDEVINFLGQMLKQHPRRHLVVVMDRSQTHTSKKTCRFIEKQKRLHVFHLPKYSPDWNPDEKLWNHLKHHEMKGHQARTIDELRKLASRKLTRLSKSRRVLRGIFFRCFVADLLH
jgi:transposase